MIQLDKIIAEESNYSSMLSLMASLSNLYSDSETPYLHYRITENLFCKYFGAKNLARTDTAYDAKLQDIGIGIKTFTMNGNHSLEKVAEFNALSPSLKDLDGLDLAYKLADFRNDRINVANGLYGINSSFYHIIARKPKSLYVYNTDYSFVDKDHIVITKQDNKSIHFCDGKEKYSFNRSKSVLMKDFNLPNTALKISVDIVDDPFSLLEQLLGSENTLHVRKPLESVLLPLFSIRNNIKYVPEKSGLNQWNASGRPRDENEVYIPIPASVHRDHQGFFPNRDTPFYLELPDGTQISAKVCQQGSKALMSNPNKTLGEWILRKVLHKKPDSLVTYQDLIIAGFDSIVVSKQEELKYSLDVSRDSSFSY